MPLQSYDWVNVFQIPIAKFPVKIGRMYSILYSSLCLGKDTCL